VLWEPRPLSPAVVTPSAVLLEMFGLLGVVAQAPSAPIQKS
jgi:hypothetical protein